MRPDCCIAAKCDCQSTRLFPKDCWMTRAAVARCTSSSTWRTGAHPPVSKHRALWLPAARYLKERGLASLHPLRVEGRRELLLEPAFSLTNRFHAGKLRWSFLVCGRPATRLPTLPHFHTKSPKTEFRNPIAKNIRPKNLIENDKYPIVLPAPLRSASRNSLSAFGLEN